MKFKVFHIFAGSKGALEKNFGGVETLLNNMLRNNLHPDIFSIVIGRRHQFLPQIITRVKVNMSKQKYAKRVHFPYVMYILSNLLLGLNLATFLSLSHRRRESSLEHYVIHVHDPIIGAALFVFAPKCLTNMVYVSQFHSEYSKRLKIMLPPDNLISKFTIQIYSFFEKLCIKRADVLIAVSNAIRNYLIDIGCPRKKIEQVPVFIETPKNIAFSTINSSSLNIDPKQFIITSVGRLSKEKNLDVLVTAFLSLESQYQKNITLLIVGAGDQFDKIRSFVTPVTDKVKLLGHRSDINFILTISNVFILTSLTEGFPFSLLEALSHGKAIIASDIPSISEIIKNEYNGLLFNPKSPKQLSDAIIRLYQDPDLRKKLGIQARYTSRQYDTKVIILKILQCYKKALQ